MAEIQRLHATMGPAAIAKHLAIARSSVYRLLDPAYRMTAAFRSGLVRTLFGHWN